MDSITAPFSWQHSVPIDFWLLSPSSIVPCSIGAPESKYSAEISFPRDTRKANPCYAILLSRSLSLGLTRAKQQKRLGSGVPLVSADDLPIGWRMSLYMYPTAASSPTITLMPWFILILFLAPALNMGDNDKVTTSATTILQDNQHSSPVARHRRQSALESPLLSRRDLNGLVRL